jgi:hypothetical protein
MRHKTHHGHAFTITSRLRQCSFHRDASKKRRMDFVVRFCNTVSGDDDIHMQVSVNLNANFLFPGNWVRALGYRGDMQKCFARGAPP